MAEMDFFDINQIVWLDETGCDKRDYVRKMPSGSVQQNIAQRKENFCIVYRWINCFRIE